ncbi:hypothetical protein [Treponema sp.]|uniref:hypothetical protein n=1 Tax=Treponema sp. TaxID=166 RepID=UPI00298DD40F|nr:hypothetical protein [Treponema sp.]MCR5612920.1 hypothetical protein [Treponema sp.]
MKTNIPHFTISLFGTMYFVSNIALITSAVLLNLLQPQNDNLFFYNTAFIISFTVITIAYLFCYTIIMVKNRQSTTLEKLRATEAVLNRFKLNNKDSSNENANDDSSEISKELSEKNYADLMKTYMTSITEI